MLAFPWYRDVDCYHRPVTQPQDLTQSNRRDNFKHSIVEVIRRIRGSPREPINFISLLFVNLTGDQTDISIAAVGDERIYFFEWLKTRIIPVELRGQKDIE